MMLMHSYITKHTRLSTTHSNVYPVSNGYITPDNHFLFLTMINKKKKQPDLHDQAVFTCFITVYPANLRLCLKPSCRSFCLGTSQLMTLTLQMRVYIGTCTAQQRSKFLGFTSWYNRIVLARTNEHRQTFQIRQFQSAQLLPSDDAELHL